jgi:hypothetical protein
MAEINHDIRIQGLARREYSITPVGISGETPVLFESGLSLEYARIGCFAYNNSDTGSGEVYWGNSTVSPSSGFPIPVGAVVEIPLVSDLPFYFCASGESTMNLRVLEIA